MSPWSSFAYTEKVAVVRPKVSDDDYDEKLDFDGVTPVSVAFLVSVQPVSSTELVAGSNPGEQVTSSWRLITPIGRDLDLVATDHLLWRGDEFDVTGDVLRWPHPTRPGEVHHVEAYLQRTQ